MMKRRTKRLDYNPLASNNRQELYGLQLQYDVSAIRLRILLREQHILSSDPLYMALEISEYGNTLIHRLGSGRQFDLLYQYNRLVEQHRQRLARLV